MACTVINVYQEEPLLWLIPYSTVYLLSWLCRLYLDGNYLVFEKHLDHVKLKQFARKKSGQKAHENRRNKLMPKIRWIPKICTGHQASSFSQPMRRGSTDQLSDSVSKDKTTYCSGVVQPFMVLKRVFCSSMRKGHWMEYCEITFPKCLSVHFYEF